MSCSMYHETFAAPCIMSAAKSHAAHRTSHHVSHAMQRCAVSCTVSSHNFNSRTFKSRVSNPRTTAYVCLKRPFESSELTGAGPIFPDWTFVVTTDRTPALRQDSGDSACNPFIRLVRPWFAWLSFLHHIDGRGDSRANACAKTRLLGRVAFMSYKTARVAPGPDGQRLQSIHPARPSMRPSIIWYNIITYTMI